MTLQRQWCSRAPAFVCLESSAAVECVYYRYISIDTLHQPLSLILLSCRNWDICISHHQPVNIASQWDGRKGLKFGRSASHGILTKFHACGQWLLNTNLIWKHPPCQRVPRNKGTSSILMILNHWTGCVKQTSRNIHFHMTVLRLQFN